MKNPFPASTKILHFACLNVHCFALLVSPLFLDIKIIKDLFINIHKNFIHNCHVHVNLKFSKNIPSSTNKSLNVCFCKFI